MSEVERVLPMLHGNALVLSPRAEREVGRWPSKGAISVTSANRADNFVRLIMAIEARARGGSLKRKPIA